MAKKRSAQVGLSLERVIYEANIPAPLFLKPWLHATQLASSVP